MAIVNLSQEELDSLTPLNPTTGVARGVADIGVKALRGTLLAAKSLSDSVSAGNAVSNLIQSGADGVSDLISQGARDQDTINSARMQNAEGKGTAAEVGAALKNFSESPLDTIAEGAGSIVPLLLAQKLGGSAAAKSKISTGMGAGMGAGSIKGEVYDAVKQSHLDAGKTEQEADALATEAQSYTGKNADQIALGAGLGALAGGTGVESVAARFGANKVASETGEFAAKDLLKSTLTGAAKEAIPEAIQGGQERLASNLAQQRDGFDVGTWTGVAGNAALEGLASAPLGGGANAAEYVANTRQKLAQTLASSGGGAITEAAQTSVLNGASDAVLSLPAPTTDNTLVVFPDGSTMTRAEAEQIYSAEELAAFQARTNTAPKEAETLALPAPTFVTDANGNTASTQFAMDELKKTLGQNSLDKDSRFKQEVSNVSNTPNATTAVATGAAQPSSDNTQGGVGDLPNQPNVSGFGDAAAAPTQSKPSNVATETGSDANGTLNRPFASATDDILPKLRGMTTDAKVISQIDEELKLRGLPNVNENVTNVAKEVTPVQDSSSNSSFSGAMAADYLLTGGFGVMESTEYLLQAYSGLSQKSSQTVENIRKKYAQQIIDSKLTEAKDFVKSDLYAQIIGEMKSAVSQAHNGNPLVDEIFADINKYPTGMSPKVGDKISAKINQLELETATSQPNVDSVNTTAERVDETAKGVQVDLRGSSNTPQVETPEKDKPKISKPAADESVDNTEARNAVEAIVKRRAAANQIGKGKAFDSFLAQAKKMLAGEVVPKNTFKLAKNAFKADPALAEQFGKLDAIINQSATDSRQSTKQVVEGIKAEIAAATDADVLDEIKARIVKLSVSDNTAIELDDTLMAKYDELLDSPKSKAKEIDSQFAGQGDLLSEPKPTENQDEVIHNGVRLYKIKVRNRVEGQPPTEMWAVESTENKERKARGERAIGGDNLSETLDEAKAEAELMLKREADNNQAADAQAKLEAEQKEKSRIDADKKSDIDGFGSELNAMQLGKLKETLNKPTSINGEVSPLRDAVRKLVSQGGKPEIKEENVYKGMSRAQYNRADNRAQQEDEKRIREGGKKNVYYITMPDGGMFELGKTAHDFAEHLITNKNSDVNETNFVDSIKPAEQTKQALDNLDAYFDHKEYTPLQKSNAKKVLEKKLRLENAGETKTQKEWIDNFAENGKLKIEIVKTPSLPEWDDLDRARKVEFQDNENYNPDFANGETYFTKWEEYRNSNELKDEYQVTYGDIGTFIENKTTFEYAEYALGKSVNQTKQALDAIKQDETIPTADKIKLAADLRNGNVTADDVSAIVGETKATSITIPDNAGMRKALTKLGYPNADLSRTERRVTINSKAVFSTDQFTVDIELKNGKWKVFEPSTPNSYTEEQSGAMEKFRSDLSVLNGEVDPAHAKSKVDDFGEKLEGARKDMVRAMAKEYSDDELASLPLSKIWPITDVNLIENKTAAAIAWTAREEIPSKPRKPYALKVWVGKVKILRDIGRIVSKALEVNPELMLQKLKDAQLGQFKSKVALLEAIDRDAWKRIGKVEEYPNAYSYVDGVKQIKPMVRIDVDGVTTTYEASSVADVIDNVNEKLGKEKQEKRMAFEVRGSSKGGYFINKKGDKNYTKLKAFDSSKEAFEFLRNNYDEVVAAWDATKDRLNVKESDVRGKENRPRTGEDYRKGKDVSSEEFATTFGFRGIQFGEWVKQGGKDNDRQGALNAAYDALMDLANIVGVPPKAMSLEGTLGLSFGARGKGSAAAHFEPSNLVINLTKTQGAGTLAHEWFHALDNYFSRKRGGEKSMAEVKSQQAYREGNFITYKPEALYINKNYGNKGITKAELERYRKQSPNSKYWSEENWILDPKHPQGVRPEVEVRFADLVDALNTSPMKQRARSIDGVKEGTDGYWSRIIELGARAFENYVIHKMQLNGYDNDYLANVVRVDSFNRDSSRFPYLLDEEVAPVAEAFDNLFSEIQTKETDNGNVAMFSRSPMKSTDANANRGEASMNQALLNKADVSRAMYHNELGWIDFVWGDDFKGIKHIIKRRMTSDGMTESEVYRLLTKDLVKTIASGEVIRSSETEKSTRLVIRGDDNEAVLVKSKSGNGWVVTGFKLNEQVNQSRGATASDLRSTEPIRSRFSEVAVLDELSTMASEYVNADGGPIFKRNDPFFSLGTGSILALEKSKAQFGAKMLNRALVKYFDDTWSDSYESVDVPDTLSQFREEIKVAFGKELRYVRPTDEKFNIFGGVQIPKSPNAIYVNARSNSNLTTIAGHELYHALERSRPDLHKWFRKQAVQYIQNFGTYRQNLNSKLAKGEKLYKSEVALSELLADFTGDALSDRKFLQELANADGNKFVGLLNVTIKFLNEAITKLKNLGSSQYIKDVEALRGDLKKVLVAFANDQDIDSSASDVSFNLDNSTTTAQLFKELTLNDDMFKYPKSNAADMQEVFNEVAPGLLHIEKSKSVDDEVSELYSVYPIDASGNPIRSKVGFINVYDDGKVEINVSSLGEGFGGSGIYAAVGNWAYNNGKVFAGDREGISPAGISRRLENMISLALKFGTTDHIMPHKDQMNDLGFDWKDGDTEYNLAEMLKASFNAIRNGVYVTTDNFGIEVTEKSNDAKGVSKLDDLVYDFDKHQFTDLSNGKPYTTGDFDKLASTSEARAAYAGRTTLQRAALGNTFMGATGEGKQFLLEQLGKLSLQPLQLTDPQLAGIFYSRSTPQTETPQFKAWFGDSKVVDKLGNPLEVFHGSPDARFVKEDGTFKSLNERYGQTGGERAFWFASSRQVANTYADDRRAFDYQNAEAGIVPAYLSIQNPLIVDGGGKVWREAQAIGKTRTVIEKAQEDGHDGVIIKNVKDDYNSNATSSRVTDTYVVFSSNQIKSSTDNNGDFNPNNPDIRFSRSSTQQPSLIPKWDAPTDNKLDDVVYALQDKHIDLKRVSQSIKKAGTDIADRWNAYLQEELYHGRTAKRTQDFIKDDLDPLIEDMRMRGVGMADFEEYLWARHAEERNIQIAKINPDMPDAGSGMSTKDARDYLAGLTAEQKANYQALAKRIDDINRKSRQVLVDYGLESKETIAAWEGAYKNYVPLMREDMDAGFGNGTGQGFSVKGNAAKRATGSNRAVVDVIANIAQQFEKNVIRGEKNRVSTALIGLAELNPNKEFWQVDNPPKIKTVSKTTGLVEEYTDPNYKNRNNVVVARTIGANGKVVERAVVFNQFDNRAMRMAGSIKNLDQDQVGELLGMASSFTRYFASINTQYNPIFGVINIVRDVQGALLNLSTTPIADKKAEVLKNTPSAWLGIYQDLRAARKGGAANSQWADLFEEFQNEGGQTGFRNMYANAQDRSEAIRNALDPLWWQNSTMGKLISANGMLAKPQQWMFEKAVKPIFDWLSDYNTSLENAVRLSVYKVALDNGHSKQQAASMAKNISVNFNRKGEMGRQIGALYAFFNASVQGTARIGETLLSRDEAGRLSLSTSGKRIVQGGLLLGAMQALLLASAGYSDDEPPEFVRDRSLIMPLDMFGADGKYLTLPMPLGFNAIPSLGRILTEWALSGGDKTQERLVHILDMVLNVTNPIGNAGLSLQTIAPTVIDPLAALAENKDFTGRPIAREDFNSLNPTAGFTRSRDKAWDFSVAIARAINWITGGNDYKQGAISPTADQLEYLAGQFTGGVGREIIKAGTTADSLLTGEDLPTYKIPLVGRFIGDSTGQASQGAEFYANVRTMNEYQNEIKGIVSQGGDVTAFMADHPEARMAKVADLALKQVQNLRKQQRALKEAGDSREQVTMIDERITAIMKRLNENVRVLKETAE